MLIHVISFVKCFLQKGTQQRSSDFAEVWVRLRHLLPDEEVSARADWLFCCCFCLFLMMNYDSLAVTCIFLPVCTWRQSPYPLPVVWVWSQIV